MGWPSPPPGEEHCRGKHPEAGGFPACSPPVPTPCGHRPPPRDALPSRAPAPATARLVAPCGTREETCMTLTITIRLPAPPQLSHQAPGMLRFARTVLPLIEPAAVLVAGSAGLGPIGQVVCVPAIRSVRQALAG